MVQFQAGNFVQIGEFAFNACMLSSVRKYRRKYTYLSFISYNCVPMRFQGRLCINYELRNVGQKFIERLSNYPNQSPRILESADKSAPSLFSGSVIIQVSPQRF
ncbi:hypothetical protein Ahy_A03g011738 isoform C [Arachis hypogaea]|uniref:Uncharacterized protein n=1 Tax=Arachis hypogaea TaxID=3818 RepID=A0A445DRK3_ARAHY|nr:hypothetical protein Ahy_A03g011738 isoform C [Arachis hypogaea]